MTELRDYQRKAVDQAGNYKRPLIVAPTGSGKTIIAAEIIRRAPNKFVLVLAHRRELIHQARDKLADVGIHAGVILAGEPRNNMASVQVASIQTLWSRAIRNGADLPPADLIFVDEAHHCRARTYRTLIEKYPAAGIVGLTATPCRKDGRGLGGTFEVLVECPQVQELIEGEYLVPTRVFAPSTPDLTGVQTRHGDYVESQLAARVDRPELVGDIVTHWHRLAARRKTVVFATSVAHSIHLRDEFVKSGVKAEHIDGSTPKDDRDRILARLSSGDLELVSNCMVLVEGWDQPDVACAVMARPTKSFGLYRQMAGRIIRPAPNKADALVLDHAGATHLFGFVEDPVHWTLDPDRKVMTPKHDSRSALSSSNLLTCTQCSAIRVARQACPECGFLPRRGGEHLDVVDAELTELSRKGKLRPNQYTPEQRYDFHRMLAYIAAERGYKPGWAAYSYKKKFGSWPDDSSVKPLAPTPEVRSWVRSRIIAFVKGKRRYG